MLDLKDAVLDNAHRKVDFAVDQESKRHKVLLSAVDGARKTHTVPAVFLIEPGTRNDERQRLKTAGYLLHCKGKDSRLVVQSLDKLWVVAVGWKYLHVKVEIRLLNGAGSSATTQTQDLHVTVVLRDGILAVGHVDERSHFPASVLGIRTGHLQSFSIDTSGQGVPERVLDHSGQSVHGILRQSSFIEDDSLSAIVAGEG